jgi:phosphoribosylformylglycinamidine (FGAM) synthase-like amidotransferase family enzyme
LKANRPRVAIVREEGCNGDREMAGAFYQAGFEPWDITMTDIAKQAVSLDITYIFILIVTFSIFSSFLILF